jgi:hypothetical protein
MSDNEFDDDEDDNELVDLSAFQELRNAEEAFDLDQAMVVLPTQHPQPRDMSSANLVPYAIVPVVEANAVRPEYNVVNNVAYYNHASKLALMYGQTVHGIKAGAIFQEENEKRIKFDF